MIPISSDNQRIQMKRNAVLPVLLLVCWSNVVLAQEKPELFSKVESTFNKKEPRWKIDQILWDKTNAPLHESIVFRAGNQQAAIEISIWKKAEDARGVFAALVADFDDTRRKKAVKTRLPNIADENYMWTNPRSKAWPMIFFRKENVEGRVYAPSISIATRFAQRVVEQIKTTP